MSTLNIEERSLLHGSVQKTLDNVEFAKQNRKNADVLQYVKPVLHETRGLITGDADYKKNNMRVYFYGLGFSVFAAQYPNANTTVSIIVKNNDTGALMKLGGNNYMPVVMHRLESGIYVLLVLDTKEKVVSTYRFDKTTNAWPRRYGPPEYVGLLQQFKIFNDTAQFKNCMGFVKIKEGKYKSYFSMMAALNSIFVTTLAVEYTDSTVTFRQNHAGWSKKDNLTEGDKIQYTEQSPAIAYVGWIQFRGPRNWQECIIRFLDEDRDYKLLRMCVKRQLDRYEPLNTTGIISNGVDQVIVEINGDVKVHFHRNYLMSDDPVFRD